MAKSEDARAMLLEGIELEKVAKITKLSLKEIQGEFEKIHEV